jgi:hypothetical protein
LITQFQDRSGPQEANTGGNSLYDTSHINGIFCVGAPVQSVFCRQLTDECKDGSSHGNRHQRSQPDPVAIQLPLNSNQSAQQNGNDESAENIQQSQLIIDVINEKHP